MREVLTLNDNHIIWPVVELYALAKAMIEWDRDRLWVLEERQVCAAGGLRGYAICSQDELERDYVGYKGFHDYDSICRSLDRYKQRGDLGDKEGKRLADLCKGIESRRFGPYHPQRVCTVDPEIRCAGRYESQELDKRFRFYCGTPRESHEAYRQRNMR